MYLSKQMKDAIELLKQEEYYLKETPSCSRWIAYNIPKPINTKTMKALERRGIVKISFSANGIIAELTKGKCRLKECELPYGGKQDCEFYKNGVCTVDN